LTVGNEFLVGGLGVELQPERSLPSPSVVSRNLLFWDFEPKRQFLIKAETDDKLKKNCICFCHISTRRFKEKRWVVDASARVQNSGPILKSITHVHVWAF
jgi:hypothetical protein